ncbi:MAG: hypothetical protein PHV02_02875 [Rhodocyclaceae bacterium]|nr:hypothetical protein [Rhodocyclaceae bacterium]
MQAIRFEATVGNDHVIHIPAPELPAGTLAEVIVLVHSRPEPQHADVTQYFGQFVRFDSLTELNQHMDTLRED